MPILDINTDDIVEMSNKLDKMHKSALPVAIRQTLNGAAFNVKGSKKSPDSKLEKSTQQKFTRREKNFFKVTSRINPAKGFNVKNMEAQLGFTDSKLKANSNAVGNLREQETGGRIDGRNFVPLKNARVGKTWNRKVKRNNRLSNISRVIDAQSMKGANNAEKFVKAAIKAGKGNHIIGTNTNAQGNRFLLKVNSVKRKGPDSMVNTTALYAYQKGRSFTVKETNFMQDASLMAARRMNDLYHKEAKKQIERLKG